MSKKYKHGEPHGWRKRNAKRGKKYLGSGHPPPPAPPWALRPSVELGGMTPQDVQRGAGAMAQDLRDAALHAQAQVRGGRSPATVATQFLTPLKHVYQGMDMVSAACRAVTPEALRPACTVGCYACCRLYVEIGPWEAFGMADYLTECWEQGVVEREAVIARLQDEVAHYEAHGKDGPPRVCAFLTGDGRCGVYPARPAPCRSFYSASRPACEAYFTQERLGASVLPVIVRTLDHGIAAQLAMAEAQVGMRPPFASGATVPMYEMQSAVLRILETPNALARYLHGEDLFVGCPQHSPEAALRATYEALVQLEIPQTAKSSA